MSAQDVDDPCAIERRATTDATATVSARELRMGHGKRALLDSDSFDAQRGEIVVILRSSGQPKVEPDAGSAARYTATVGSR